MYYAPLVVLLALLSTLMGANPGWPPAPDLDPEAYGLAAHQPDDPGYGPGPGCDGQLGLYSFLPDCLYGIGAEERAAKLGSGASFDRAWAYTIGRPEVLLAVVDTGVDFSDRELIGRIALNAGELTPPAVGAGGVYDRNGDHAFTVLDYTSATGTTAPTTATILDTRLLGRADRGDVNGNGLLDPGDLLAIFRDGRDDDGNGFVDDLAGWDFLEEDPDPSGTGTGPELLHALAASANDGRTIAGACPACTVLPIRVTSGPIAKGSLLAIALDYAATRGAVVAANSTGALDDGPALAAKVEALAPRLLVVTTRGQLGGQISAWPRLDALLPVGAIGLNALVPAEASSVLWPAPSSGSSADFGLVAPGRPGAEAVALVAGAAGLLYAESLGLERLGIPSLVPPLAADQARQLLLLTAQTIRLGKDARGGFERSTGYGRVDAAAALEALRAGRIPPRVQVWAPQARAVLDPSPGAPIPIELQIAATARGRVSYQVDAAPGQAPAASDWATLATGAVEASGDEQIQLELPTLGLGGDPTGPWSLSTDYALTLRVTAQGQNGARAEARRVVFLHRDLDLLPAFPLNLGEGVLAAPRLVDQDGDGRAELWIATSGGRLLSVGADGTITERQRVSEAFLATPSVLSAAERKAGGRPVVPTNLGVALGDDLVLPLPRPGTSTAAPAGQTSAALLADLEGDGSWTLVLPRPDGTLWFLDVDGSPSPSITRTLDGPAGTPALGDLDGDGRPELVVATRRSVYFLQPDGSDWAPPLPWLGPGPGLDRSAAYFPSPALADLDGDGLLDVALAGQGRSLQVAYGKDRRSWIEFSPGRATRGGADVAPLGPPFYAAASQVAIADLNADDQPELVQVVVSQSQDPSQPRTLALGVFQSNGDWLPGFPRLLPDHGGLDVTIADLDGDRRPEILVPSTESLLAFSFDGSTPRRFPKLVGGALRGPPAVGDLDGDGLLELAAVTEEGRVFVWRTQGRVGDRVPWNGFHHDARATGNLTDFTLLRPGSASGACGCRATSSGAAPGLPWMILSGLLLGRRRRRAASGPFEVPRG